MENIDIGKWHINGNNIIQEINHFFVVITPISVGPELTDDMYEIITSENREDSINYVLVAIDKNLPYDDKTTCAFPSMFEALFFTESYISYCDSIESINKSYNEYVISTNNSYHKGLVS